MAFTDAFTDTNGTALENHGTKWVNVQGGADSADIQTNQYNTFAGGVAVYRYNDTFAAAQYAKATLKNSTGSPGVAVRAQSGAASCYYSIQDGGAGKVFNGELIAGSATDWDSGLTIASTNDVIELASDSGTTTTFYYKVNGSTIATYTGKSALSGGQGGVSGAGSGGRLDDWEGGDVTGVTGRRFQKASIVGV